MIRFRRLNFALVLLLLLPAAGFAQKDSQFTKEANKYIGLAMTKSDREGRNLMYEQALLHLKQGQERDAQNAKVWLLSGTVLAALGQMADADEAWKKAVQMHPEYAADIADEREAAWIDAFNVGMEAMDKQQYLEAIKLLEGAQVVYAERPEALMNLGALYANQGDNAKAEKAFQDAITATKGPLFEKLEADGKAEWVRFREMAQINIAQIYGAQGVDSFQADKFEEAAAQFLKAAETNPYSRDYVFNYAQSIWALVSVLEDEHVAATAARDSAVKAKDATKQAAVQEELDRLETQLADLYDKVEAKAKKSLEFDPYNGNLYLIQARTYRMRGEFAADDAGKKVMQDQALALLETHYSLPVVVDEVSVAGGGESATITGVLKPNPNSAGELVTAAGKPLTVRFTLLGLNGQAIGEQTITVNAPAADAPTPFEAKTEIKGELAGWKYVIS